MSPNEPEPILRPSRYLLPTRSSISPKNHNFTQQKTLNKIVPLGGHITFANYRRKF